MAMPDFSTALDVSITVIESCVVYSAIPKADQAGGWFVYCVIYPAT